MPRLEGGGALATLSRLSKIAEPILCVAQIIKQVRVPIPGVDQALVLGGGRTKPPFGICLVPFGKCAFFRSRNAGRESCDREEENEMRFHGRRLSISSRTSS